MAKKQSGSGDLLHFGSVRMRVVGSGDLNLTLYSLSPASNSSILPSITMEGNTNRQPTSLANYVDQYGQLEFLITEIDEYFEIDKIIMFVRPVATGYPQ